MNEYTLWSLEHVAVDVTFMVSLHDVQSLAMNNQAKRHKPSTGPGSYLSKRKFGAGELPCVTPLRNDQIGQDLSTIKSRDWGDHTRLLICY